MSVFAEFDLPVTAYPLGPVLNQPLDVEVERVVPTAGSTHYVWIKGPDREEIDSAVDDDGLVVEAVTIDDLVDRVLLRLRWDERPAVLDRLAEVDARLDRLVGTKEGWSLAATFPDQATVSAFTSACREHGLEVEVNELAESNYSVPNRFALTDAQVDALAIAFEHGYFEVPRAITLAGLSEELGVSEQAISERLRRGLFSLLRAFIDTDTP